MRLENKAAEKILKAEIDSFGLIVRQANKHTKALKDLKALIENPIKFCVNQIYDDKPAAKELGLSALRLCQLYDVPLSEIKELAIQLNNEDFIQLVIEEEGKLKLSPEKVEKYIKDNCFIQLTKVQERAYKESEKAIKALNALTKSLKDSGIYIPPTNLLKMDYEGLFTINENYLLSTIRR